MNYRTEEEEEEEEGLHNTLIFCIFFMLVLWRGIRARGIWG